VRNHLLSFTVALAAIALIAVGCAPKAAPTEASPTEAMYGPEAPSAEQVQISPSTPTATREPTLSIRPTLVASPTRLSLTASKPKPPVKGAEAFDFEIETLDGTLIRLSDLRGKTVMLNFWASWCGPCRMEIPHMVEAYEDHAASDFEILAVNLREDPGRVAQFVSEFGMTFPIALDTTGSVGASYYVRSIPTSLFLNEQGIITAVHVGTLTERALQGYLAQLLPE